MDCIMLHNKVVHDIHWRSEPLSCSAMGSEAALENGVLLQDCQALLHGFEVTHSTACTCLLDCMPSHVD